MTIARAFGIVFFLSQSLFAQDTVRLTLPQADSLLITRNLSLIASRYNVDMAAAAKIQSKLFSNPELETEWNLYNPTKSKWFDIGNGGQKIIALQKEFQIGGQRRTSIKLSEEEERMTELEYEALIRSLRYELHVTFYRYYYLNHAVTSIDSQLRLLKNLIQVYTDQYRKGNISLQELTRLNTTHFNINKQVKDVQQEQIRLQETLRVLLSEERVVLPDASNEPSYDLQNVSLAELIDKAITARPEIKSANSLQEQNRLRYALAKKEAIPSLSGGVVYDQSGSYIDNYTGVTLGLQIPIFDRNQGRIQIARIGIKQGEKLQQATEQKVRNEVRAAWDAFNLMLSQYNEVGEDHEAQLNLLSDGLVNNYSKSNISLLEFTDLFEAYNTNIIQYNQLKADLNQSYEELNYAVGTDIRN